MWPSWESKSPQATSFFDGKYRKKVRREMPAASAIASTLVASKPSRAKSSRPTWLTRVTVVAGRRPTRDATSPRSSTGPLPPGTRCHYGPRHKSRPGGDTMAATPNSPQHDEVLVEETLVEEVSIDGMCGVY
ncbi:hypothetical protein GCM10027047_31490 [Rhodococcus aerolatus]